VKVIDTGHGIAPEVRERIFEPFFTTKNEWHGQGLGLTYAFRVFEQHGGVIRAESEVNKGTTMTVRLPAARHRTHIV